MRLPRGIATAVALLLGTLMLEAFLQQVMAARRHAAFSGDGECSPLVPPHESPHKLRMMPLGDSISICCHLCGVPAAVLPPRLRHRAEPPAAYDGYIKRLWRMLHDQFAGGGTGRLDAMVHAALPFRFVGRVRTCMKNSSQSPRVRTDDWEVMYEAYYGYTTKRLNREIIVPAMLTQDPDVVLLHLGTNDLIQPKYNTVGWPRVSFAMRIYEQVIDAIMGVSSRVRAPGAVGGSSSCPQPGPQTRNATRHLFVSLLIPYDDASLGPDAHSGNRALRRGKVRHFNDELLRLVIQKQLAFAAPGREQALAAARVEYDRNQRNQTDDSSDEMLWLRRFSLGHLAGLSRIHVVDMNTNFSVTEDLHGDGVHPNERGEHKLAQRYWQALQPLFEDRALFFPHLTELRDGGAKSPAIPSGNSDTGEDAETALPTAEPFADDLFATVSSPVAVVALCVTAFLATACRKRYR